MEGPSRHLKLMRKLGFAGSVKYYARRARRYFVAGALTAIPIYITIVIFAWLVELLTDITRPFVSGVVPIFDEHTGALGDLLWANWFQETLAFLLTVALLIALGWVAAQVAGKRALRAVDLIMERLPVVHQIYGASKQLLTAMQTRPDGVDRVVLIEFPNPGMRTIGFVTRTMKDRSTGELLAAVYVPTTPNPTSGYLEIVPRDRLIDTNWTMDEAMRFIISGGAVAPEVLDFNAPPVASDTAPSREKDYRDLPE